MSELRKIPNVGKATEADLIAMGYTTIESLRGADPQRLYEQECALRGQTIDRCQLYLYRAVVYWVNTPSPDPERANGGIGRTNISSLPPAGFSARNVAISPRTARAVGR